MLCYGMLRKPGKSRTAPWKLPSVSVDPQCVGEIEGSQTVFVAYHNIA